MQHPDNEAVFTIYCRDIQIKKRKLLPYRLNGFKHQKPGFGMVDLKVKKDEWRKMLAAGRWKPLFNDISDKLADTSEHTNRLLLHRSKYTHTFAQEMEGTLSRENAGVEYVRLSKAMLVLIDDITPEDVVGTSTQRGESPLKQQLEALQFKQPITPLYLLNCDRKKSERNFNRTFRQWEQERQFSQCYISLGCPTQNPEAFAERIVFEVIAKKEDTHVGGIFFPRTTAGRMQLLPMEMGFNLEDTQQRFKKQVARHFQANESSFEDFLTHELPARQETYLFFPFSIAATDWDPDISPEYLQWLLDTFPTRPAKGPVCVFLFVVSLRDAHEPARIRYEREVFEQVQELTASYQQITALFHPLPPVPRYYLEEWFGKVCANPVYEVNTLIDLFCKNLTPAEQEAYTASGKEQLIDMERIIAWQAQVGEIANAKSNTL